MRSRKETCLLRKKNTLPPSTRKTSQRRASSRRFLSLCFPQKRQFLMGKIWAPFSIRSKRFPKSSKRRTTSCSGPYSSRRTTIRQRDCSASSSISIKALPWRDTRKPCGICFPKSREHHKSFKAWTYSKGSNSGAALKLLSSSSRERSRTK